MSFFTEVLQKHALFHTTKQVSDPMLLEPVTRAAVLAIIEEARGLGHDLRIVETYRSRERQALLFQRHATKLKTVGVHGYGLGCDVGLYVLGKYIGSAEPYAFLPGLARKHGMLSGYDWGHGPNYKNDFVDAGHLQRCALKDQPRLFAGSFYPDDRYSPFPATQVASTK